MILSGLRLNEEKTECFYSVHVISPVRHWNLFVLGVTVRYLGVILDPSADIEDHSKKIYKTCHFHLINISRMKNIYLDRESTEAIIHAFVTTSLDYCQ